MSNSLIFGIDFHVFFYIDRFSSVAVANNGEWSVHIHIDGVVGGKLPFPILFSWNYGS